MNKNFYHYLTGKNKNINIVQPGIEILLYAPGDINSVVEATANTLQTYLEIVPNNTFKAIFWDDLKKTNASYADPDDDDNWEWCEFKTEQQQRLAYILNNNSDIELEDGFNFTLFSNINREETSEFKFSFSGIGDEDPDDEMSNFLRLEFCTDFTNSLDIELLVQKIDLLAGKFPFHSGNAGYCFLHSAEYVRDALKWVNTKLTRYKGFDCMHLDSLRLSMKGKSPPAHWMNFLNEEIVDKMGGFSQLKRDLPHCEIKEFAQGRVRIRSAKYPPIVDVNLNYPDAGQIANVSRYLSNVRLVDGHHTHFEDSDAGERWLSQLDDLESRNWGNR